MMRNGLNDISLCDYSNDMTVFNISFFINYDQSSNSIFIHLKAWKVSKDGLSADGPGRSDNQDGYPPAQSGSESFEDDEIPF